MVLNLIIKKWKEGTIHLNMKNHFIFFTMMVCYQKFK